MAKPMKPRFFRHRWVAAAAAIVAAGAPRAAQACAMCGLPPGDHQAHAYNTSVLFMMAVPYSIVAGTIVGLYLAYRRGRHKLSTGPRSTRVSAPQNLVQRSFE